MRKNIFPFPLYFACLSELYVALFLSQLINKNENFTIAEVG